MRKIIFSFIIALIICLSSCNNNNPNIPEYEIVYYEGDEILDIEYVKEGENAVGINTSRPGYTFSGWDQELTNITTDLEVHGKWTKEKYIVRFLDGDNLIYKYECYYNESVTAPKVSKEHGYTLSWDKPYDEIKENTDIYLVRTKVKFKVTFYDFEGSVFETQDVEYLSQATVPNLVQDNYVLTGWDKDFSKIENDLEVYPLYHKEYASITYMLGDNVLNLAPATFKVGDTVELPSLSNNDYYFTCWCLDKRLNSRIDNINENVSGDLVLYAKVVYKERINEIKLDPNSAGHFTSVKCIGDCWQPQLPVSASVQDFDWSTSDSSVATISSWSSISIHSSGYCVVQAVGKSTKVKYDAVIKTTIDGVTIVTESEANIVNLVKVTFTGKDSEIIEEQYVEKGGHAYAPNPLEYTGYRFDGWDHEIYNITENTVIKGKYVQGISKYSGKYISIIGDSISTFADNIPEGYKTFYPYPVADVNDVNMTWSSQVVNRLGGQLLSNNSYSGSMVDGNDTYQSKHIERLQNCAKQNVAPDVIIIYMGSNDHYSATTASFTKAYEEMIQNIYKLFPSVEIVLCDLPQSKYYSEEQGKTMNDVIESLSIKYSLTLVKLSEVSIKNTLIDSAHPKYAGQKLMADKIISELLK